MATLTHPLSTSFEENELLLISHPPLREQLLQARLVDSFSARSVIQRGEHVYLSLREIGDPMERQATNWAILKLQMGANIPTQELPPTLRTVLTAVSSGPSPLIAALVWGSLCGVVGGVLVMAVVGLAMTILNVPTESYVGFMATAVAFVLSGTVIGLSGTVYFWRRFTNQCKKRTSTPTLPIPTIAKMPR
ncbi:hypothetical protein [Candidatus Leptofilum sp.]|uniref:hypothetical protein n=1 Tax=Candidatus Leptofilum sp. TaxID=3241576 RepID=UPI003B5A8868